MKSFELMPVFVSHLWGGRRLAHLPGAPTADPIAEIWLASDLPDRPTRIAGGDLEGRLIREIMDCVHFPLLVKIIDTALPLSVQVHPNDDHVRANDVHSYGKTEAWVVLHAEPGSRIYAGLRPGVTSESLRAALADDAIESVLHSFEPQVGDVVFIPAGTVHALGAGLTVFELQQSSDVTYRLHDWKRVDPKTGRPRALHIDEALACINYAQGQIRPTRGEYSSVMCPHFQLFIRREPATIGGDGKTRILVSYGGSATGCVKLQPGQAVLVPAMHGECRINPKPGAWVFECVVP
jgi:mannose-6-phosphate isomerase